ncbi:MAG: hypothetical protein JO102_06730 [Elusimicrobia bacterium]|nr:hypothetical protein [Elusimicrobiota bacterium]
MKRFLLALAIAAVLPAVGLAGGRPGVAIRLANDVVVAKGEQLETALAVFGSVTVDGDVTGNAVALFGNVNIGSSGSVGANAVAVGGAVFRSQGSRLDGRAIGVSGPGRILSRLLMLGLPMAAVVVAGVGVLLVIASSLGFVALVVVILLLFEDRVRAARQALQFHPVRSLAFGFVGFLALMPLTILLTVSIVGIPLALAVAVVAAAAVCLGAVAVCEWLGAELSTKTGRPLQPLWSGLLGLVVLVLIGFVPLLGRVIHAAAVVAGLGAGMQTRFGAGPD